MKLVNTHISKNCTRKVLVYVDGNGHYHLKQYELKSDFNDASEWHLDRVHYGRTKFKHIESANKAVQKWLSPKSS